MTAVLTSTCGAIDCHRTLHVYLRVNTVPCRWIHPRSDGVVSQRPSLDVSSDGPAARRIRSVIVRTSPILALILSCSKHARSSPCKQSTAHLVAVYPA